MKQHSKWRGAALMLGALCMVDACNVALAQEYPVKPIRTVVAYAPGGSTEIIARLFADKLKDRIGQPVIVDSRPGGGTRIGTEFVAKQPPDGYTLFHATVAFATTPALSSRPTYDPIRDFTPVIQLAASLLTVVVNPELPVKDMRQLIDWLKQDPARRSYPSQGVGSSSHLAAQMFWSLAGIDMQHVPFKGGSAAHIEVVSGRLPVLFDTYSSVIGLTAANKLRLIATTGQSRAPILPDVPTIAESSPFPSYKVDLWQGVLAPAKTPAPIVNRLIRGYTEVLANQDMRNALAKTQTVPLGASGAQFGEILKDEVAKWSRIIKETGARGDD